MIMEGTGERIRPKMATVVAIMAGLVVETTGQKRFSISTPSQLD